jgi:muramoyltetrapeptide carboxypeptidase
MVPFEIKGSVEILRSGTAQGALAGGNLATINHLLGTPFELNFDNKILILEDINEAPYAIDRLIYQLYLAGKFKHLKGLILGDFSDCGDIETIWQMILDLLTNTTYPIWGNFPVGHQKQNILYPVGGIAQMDSTNGVLSYHERVMVKD